MSYLKQADLLPVFAKSQSLLWCRDESGHLLTNVQRRIVHHSPTGFEIGYPGSGPADLALNILAALFPIHDEPGIQCFQGIVSRRAWALHQAFKFDLLARADRIKGEIAWRDLANWLINHRERREPR